MFRFLRFEISGASTLVWTLLFLTPYLNIEPLTRIDAVKVLAFVFGSISISFPLGNVIHQASDTLLSPYSMNRLVFWPRRGLIHLRQALGDRSGRFFDQTFQAVLVFAKAHNRTLKMGPVGKSESFSAQEIGYEFKAEVVREEISNRYSYYYARMENGMVAPFLGFFLAYGGRALFEPTIYVTHWPAFSIWWIIVPASFLALAMIWRIPQLFREIDDLEISLIDQQRDCWPRIN